LAANWIQCLAMDILAIDPEVECIQGPNGPLVTVQMDDGTIVTVVGGMQTNSWGNQNTLEDHFNRHGSDFGSGSQEEYAQQAKDFLLRAQAQGLPTKIDPTDGSIRVYDPATNEFGSYNANGTTRTYFQPSSATYFARQPGIEPIIVPSVKVEVPVQLELPFP
jgi:hypothetical protein